MAVILRSRSVLPVCAPPIADGAVVIEQETIVAVGPWCEIAGHYAGEVLDLGEQILLPGFVNAHCHLDYSMMRRAIDPRRSFTEWVRRINALKRSLTDEDYLAAIARGFAELRKWGTTTVANIESFPELLPRMPAPPIRTWWFFEMIDIRHRETSEEMVEGALAFFAPREGWLGGFGLSPHAPYTASASLYALSARAAEQMGMPVTTHVAESCDEWEMFRHARGELHDFVKQLGRWMEDCHHARSPFAHLAAHAPLSERWILAHMNELDAADFAWLERCPPAARPSVVHCPGSHGYFQHAPFPLEKLRKAGVNLCLGTDSLASTDSLSLLDEMRLLSTAHPGLPPETIVQMGTWNGGRALGAPVGKIAPGALADLIAIPIASADAALYETVIHHRAPIAWLMVNGQITPQK